MTPAAQYIRVSSDQQRHSLPGQVAEIAEFAAAHGFEIVRTYEDKGRSGLHLKGRAALQALLSDVLAGTAPFEAVLVQDVSRWGRFQDTDEAAHYEYLCRAAGVAVRYCAEPFDSMSGRTGDLVKAVKRMMAADFSRELSAKVRNAQFRHAQTGFKMGGVAGFGLRRAIIDAAGQVTAVLELGQQRLLRADRIVFVHGPDHEVETVRRIFRMFLEDGLGLNAIVEHLNAEGVCGEGGRPWSSWTVGNLLGNPKYAGTYRFGRRRRTLDGRRLNNAPDQMLWVVGALAPVVPSDWIAAAAAKRQRRMLFLPRAEIWRRLRAHAAGGGAVTRVSVDNHPDLPSFRTCANHFGPGRRISARLGRHPPFLPGQIDRRSVLAEGPSHRLEETPVPPTFTAFVGEVLITAGAPDAVALAVHAAQDRQTEMPIVFDDATGLVVDLDLRGSPQEVLDRLRPVDAPGGPAPRGRGRPRLGVTAREVTLLPEHWAWLQQQPGGTSAALRRLVEQARKDNAAIDARRSAQTATYKVMYALAGHLRGYEDALRALYAGDRAQFEARLEGWPADISRYLRGLAGPSFGPAS